VITWLAPSTGLTISDTSIVAAMTLDEIGNPGADKIITMGTYGLKFDWNSDDGETTIRFTFESDALETDTDNVLWKWTIDADGTPYVVWKLAGTTSGIVGSGRRIINSDLLNFTSLDNIRINSVNFDEIDPTWETGISGTTLTMTGAIVGELQEIDNTDIESVGDDLTAAMCRGTLITNEGASESSEYDLPTAESGLHFKAICAEAQVMYFDAQSLDNIYVSDDDAIILVGDGDMVKMACDNVGESMTCVTFTTDDSNWDWLCECGAGECTDGGAGS